MAFRDLGSSLPTARLRTRAVSLLAAALVFSTAATPSAASEIFVPEAARRLEIGAPWYASYAPGEAAGAQHGLVRFAPRGLSTPESATALRNYLDFALRTYDNVGVLQMEGRSTSGAYHVWHDAETLSFPGRTQVLAATSTLPGVTPRAWLNLGTATTPANIASHSMTVARATGRPVFYFPLGATLYSDGRLLPDPALRSLHTNPDWTILSSTFRHNGRSYSALRWMLVAAPTAANPGRVVPARIDRVMRLLVAQQTTSALGTVTMAQAAGEPAIVGRGPAPESYGVPRVGSPAGPLTARVLPPPVTPAPAVRPRRRGRFFWPF